MSEQTTDLKKLIKLLSKRIRTEDPATFFADLDEFLYSVIMLIFAFAGVSLPDSVSLARPEHAFFSVENDALPAQPELAFSSLFSSSPFRNRTCA